MGTASSTEHGGQAVEETAESSYQRKATAAYCKFGARDDRVQPALSRTSLKDRPKLLPADHAEPYTAAAQRYPRDAVSNLKRARFRFPP